MFDLEHWAGLPFHFWSVVFFVLGAMIGSFLNVCIHRLPREESLVSPGSHCPHCGAAISWYRNFPLFSWLTLRGRCANCHGPISARYFLVELLTAGLFLASWLAFGGRSWALALVYCVFLAGLIAAAFIDFEHTIIPDAITLGGIVAGFLGSFLVPELHRADTPTVALQRCFVGAGLGAGLIYGTLRLGKLWKGKQRLALPPASRVVFTETGLVLPDQEIPYGDLFYRSSDAIQLEAAQVEMVDRCYRNVPVSLTQTALRLGEEEFPTESVPGFEVVTDWIVVPREAMGLGDVKFMAAIGAFLGWSGVLFTLFTSALMGSAVGLTLIALHRQDRSRPIPYGPFIAVAATVWIFAGDRFLKWWLGI
jgi:leader peptidase (prepilin peptidase)/N-methyltransferase